MTKKVITIEDVHKLVDVKGLDPNISPDALFRKLDRVHAGKDSEMWRFLWTPLILYVLSIGCMLFVSTNSSWNKLSIIVFVGSSIWGGCILSKYEKKPWWIILLDIFVFYVIYTESLSIDEFIKFIKQLISVSL